MGLNSELERFARDVETIEALRGELGTIGTDPAAVVQFANAKGYTFTLADVQSPAAMDELTEAQLKTVAGGLATSHRTDASLRRALNRGR